MFALFLIHSLTEIAPSVCPSVRPSSTHRGSDVTSFEFAWEDCEMYVCVCYTSHHFNQSRLFLFCAADQFFCWFTRTGQIVSSQYLSESLQVAQLLYYSQCWCNKMCLLSIYEALQNSLNQIFTHISKFKTLKINIGNLSFTIQPCVCSVVSWNSKTMVNMVT